MKGIGLFITLSLILAGTLAAQTITVDDKKLSAAIEQKLIGDITEKITSSVKKGEAWVADATYFSIILEPYASFGIDPNNPNFLNKAYKIHQTINKKLQEDPGLAYNSLLKVEIGNIVKQGMNNYMHSLIDDDSKAIYNQVKGLVSSGRKKIQDLLEATEKVKQVDLYDPDYESSVTSILKQYGIKSDYFYVINDLHQVIAKGYEKVKDPVKAIGIIAKAAGSKDPTYKIQMLLKLGETFGGKVPVIGELITPLFTLGKGVFDAAKGLENILEKNLNQGCIDPGATYGAINPGKRKNFIDKFGYVERACPLNQGVFSPIYNNIYYNTANEQELFFYIKNNWFRGKKDALHKGARDIRATIQWLRRYGGSENANKINDLGFVFNSYQKEYGWSAYSEALDKRIRRMAEMFRATYNTVEICDENRLRDFFMNKMGFSWITRLLQPTGQDFSWEDLKHFEIWGNDIKNRMIYNYYLSRNKHNLGHFDQIISNLETEVPIHIYGTVKGSDGIPIQGAVLQVGTNTMFQTGDRCHQTTTGSMGQFSYYLLMPLGSTPDAAVILSVSADPKISGRYVESQDIRIVPSQSRHYRVDLISPVNDQDQDTSSNDDQTGADVTTLLNNADCANDPNAIVEWDDVNQKVICSCVDPYIWDPGRKKCIINVPNLLANSDCSAYPNTEPKWDNVAQEVYCDCIDGYVWDEDNYNNGCISKKDQLLAQTDCSQYLHAEAVWNEVTQQPDCKCLTGYEWSKDGTVCISSNQAALQNVDCSAYPNTEPVWDPVNQEAYCDCMPGYDWNEDYTVCEPIAPPPQTADDYCPVPNTEPVYDNVLGQMVCDCKKGYKWNKDQTACIPVKRKPNIDWAGVINMTLDIYNALNGGMPGTTPGGMTSNTGGGTAPQQPVVHQSSCNGLVKSGSNAPEIHYVDLGRSFGSFVLDYDVYQVKDQIVVKQGGRVIYNTGCISGANSVRLNLNGFSREITVEVHPNCEGTSSTDWTFTVHCPDQ